MQPAVSVIMANYNGEPFLAGAMQAVLRQTLGALELIVVDDNSTDASSALAQTIARADTRVRVLASRERLGPAGARNRALAIAEGVWIAVVDSDDLLHCERLGALLAEAETERCDIIADNQVLFDAEMRRPLGVLLDGPLGRRGGWIDARSYVRANTFGVKGPSLGVLKPLIKREALERHRLRYDERLSIAEDYDLIIRALQAGLRYRVSPFIGYYYRKHPASISHRLSRPALDAMAANAAEHCATAQSSEEYRAHLRRARSIADARHFLDIIEAIKTGRAPRALASLIARPGAGVFLAQAVEDKLKGFLPPALERARLSLQSKPARAAIKDALSCVAAS